nr:hypothetical protein CFP56_18079 [Quercus suber]
MHPPVGWSPYRGGGRKSGRPYRGGGRGNFGQHHPRSSGSGPPFRGRGRGRGRGGPRHFPSHGASSMSSHPEPSATEDAESTDDGAEPSADAPEGEAQAAVPPEPSSSAQSQGKIEHNRRPPQAAWCELCRVDCTSVETLEQHKNGKKHKKNLLKLEELKNAVKLGADMLNEQNPTAESEQKVSQKLGCAQNGEVDTQMENLPAIAVTNENKQEAEQQTNNVERPEVPVQETSDLQGRNPMMDRFDNRRHGMKRHQQPYYAPPGSLPSSGPYVTPQAQQAASTAIGTDPQFQQHPNNQVSEAFLESGSHNAVTVTPNSQQQEAIVEPELRPTLAVEGNPVNGV